MDSGMPSSNALRSPIHFKIALEVWNQYEIFPAFEAYILFL